MHRCVSVLFSSHEYILCPQPHLELFLGHLVADIIHRYRHVLEDIPRLRGYVHE